MHSHEQTKQLLQHNDTFARHLDICILEMGEDYGVVTMPLETKQKNWMGHAHGGAIFALADMAFACVSSATGVFWVTAQSSISYLEPGKTGPLRAEARKIRKGHHMSVYEIRITDAHNALIALATFTGYNTEKAIFPEDTI